MFHYPESFCDLVWDTVPHKSFMYVLQIFSISFYIKRAFVVITASTCWQVVCNVVYSTQS